MVRIAGQARSSFRGTLPALILSVLIAVACAFAAQAQNFSFSNFVVEGNQRIEDASVLTLAGIEPGQAVTAGEVNDAQQRLQNSGLFESVDIVPQGGTLVIRVQEFPTISTIAIEGNQRINDDALRPLLNSQERRVYSPAVAEQDAAAIAAAYRQAGRLAATVRPVIVRRDENRVDLVFEVSEGRVVETQRISFNGNRAYSDRRLRRVLESTQAGLFRLLVSRDTFIEDRIAFDQQLLTDFYQDRGFVDFQVLSVTSELARGRDAFFVTFNLREGQSYDFGQITVVSNLPEIDVPLYQDAIRVRPGNTYSPRLVDNTITRLEELASQQGLRFIRVEPRVTRNDATLTLDIEMVISRGERVFVERIDIEGNSTTLDRVIRRQFDTVEGDPFDPRAIRRAAERIRALAFFSNVDVESRPGSASNQVVVDVDVEEQPTGSLGVSLSFSTDDGAGVAFTFSESNFLGRGQRLQFGVSTVSDASAFNFSFVEPAFLRRDLSFGISAGFSESDNQNNQDFDLERAFGEISFGFPTGEFSRGRVFYRLSEETVDDVTADSSIIIQADEGSRTTSAIGFGFTYDTRGTGLDPTTGVLLQLSQEVAGLGGDNEYLRTTGLVQGVTSVLREEVSLSATLEAGALSFNNGNSRITDRFFLNSRQIRGFEPQGLGPRDLGAPNQDALGGNFYAVARFEAGFPLGLPDEYGITGGLFFDVGSVWGLDDTNGSAGVVDDDLILRSTLGFSIFWDTAIGPLRFNFSTPIQSEDFDDTRNFEFTVQTRF